MARHSFLEEWEDDAGMALLRPAATSMKPTELVSIPRGGSESAPPPKKNTATKQASASQKVARTFKGGSEARTRVSQPCDKVSRTKP